MSVEDRVEALEEEVRVLKTEIQSVLLEIQGQILMHYYPVLHGEQDVPRESVAARSAADSRVHSPVPVSAAPGAPAAPSVASGGNGAPIPAIIPEEPPEDDLPQTQVRAVSLADVRADHMTPEHKRSLLSRLAIGADGQGGAAQHAPHAPESDRFADLLEWAGDSTRRIGKERTLRLLSVYATWGYISNNAKAALRQLVELADEEPNPNGVDVSAVADVLAKLNRVLGCGSDIQQALAYLEV